MRKTKRPMPQPTLNEADKEVIVSAILTAAGWLLLYAITLGVAISIVVAIVTSGD